jgi:Uncharacterized protein conserved in bacteria (DUF2252)
MKYNLSVRACVAFPGHQDQGAVTSLNGRRADRKRLCSGEGDSPVNSRLLSIHQATSSYEAWLGRWLPLVNDDLNEKYKRMREDPFQFLRATFYRWAQRWPVVCAALADAPEVLAVGDIHVENFGTWRDAEGRLVWGVNDVDDAWTIPYTNDLVRLATSAGWRRR